MSSNSGINVALMGLGVVGGGVAAALLEEPSPVAARVGRPRGATSSSTSAGRSRDPTGADLSKRGRRSGHPVR